MSPAPSRGQGFTVGTLDNLRDDLVADYYFKRFQNGLEAQQAQAAQMPPSPQEQDEGVNWLNVAGLGALTAALGAGAYALARGRRPPGRVTPGAEPPAAAASRPPAPPSGPQSGPSAAPAGTYVGATVDLNPPHVNAMNSGGYQSARRNGGTQSAQSGTDDLRRPFPKGFYAPSGEEKIRQIMKARGEAGFTIFDKNTGIDVVLDPSDLANYGLTVKRRERTIDQRSPEEIINKLKADYQPQRQQNKSASQPDISAFETPDGVYYTIDSGVDLIDSIGQAETDSQKDVMAAINRTAPKNLRQNIFITNDAPLGESSPRTLMRPEAVINLAAQGLIPLDIAKKYIATVPQAQRTSVIPKKADAIKNQMIGLGLTGNQSRFIDLDDTQRGLLEQATQASLKSISGDIGDTLKIIASSGEIPNPATKGATAYNQGNPDPTVVFSSQDGGSIELKPSATYDRSSYQPMFAAPEELENYKLLRQLVTDMDLTHLNTDSTRSGGQEIHFGYAGELTGPKQNLVNSLYRKNILGMAQALGYSDDQLPLALMNPDAVENHYLTVETLRQKNGLEPLGVQRNAWNTLSGDQVGSIENKMSGGMIGSSGQGFTDAQMQSAYGFSPREIGEPNDLRTALVLSGTGSGSELYDFPEAPSRLATKDPSKPILTRRYMYGDDPTLMLPSDKIAAIDYDKYVTLPYRINNTGPALITTGADESIGGIRSFGNYSTPTASEIRRNLPMQIRDVAQYINGKFVVDPNSLGSDVNLESIQSGLDKTNSLLRSYVSDPYKTKYGNLDLLNPADQATLSQEQAKELVSNALDNGIIDVASNKNMFIRLPMGLAFSDPKMEAMVDQTLVNPKQRINILFNNPYNGNKGFETADEGYSTYLNYVRGALQRFGNSPSRSIFGKKDGKTIIDRAILEGVSTPREQQVYNQYLQNVKRDLATSYEVSPSSLEVLSPLTGRKTFLDPYVTVGYAPNRPSTRGRGATGTITPISLQEAIRTELMQQEDSPVRMYNVPGTKIVEGEEIPNDGEYFHVKRYAVPQEGEFSPTILPQEVKSGIYPEVMSGPGGYVTEQGVKAVPDNLGFLRAFDEAYKKTTGGKRLGSVAFVLDRLDKLSTSNPEAARFIGGRSSNPALERALQDAYTVAGISDKRHRLNIQKPPAPATRETHMEGAGYDTYRGFDAATNSSERAMERTLQSIDQALASVDPSSQEFAELQALKTKGLQDLAGFRGGRKVVSRKAPEGSLIDRVSVGIVPTRKAPSPEKQWVGNDKNTEKLLFPRSTRIEEPSKNAKVNQPAANIYADDMGQIPTAADAQAIYKQSQDANSVLDNYEERQNLTNNSRAIKAGIGENVLGGYLSVERAFNPRVVNDLQNLDRRIALARGEKDPGLMQARLRGRLGQFIDTADEAIVLPEGQTQLTPEIKKALSTGKRMIMLPTGGMYLSDQGKLIKLGKTETDLVDRLGLTRENIKTEMARKGVQTVPVTEINKRKAVSEPSVATDARNSTQLELDLMVPVKQDGQAFLTRYAGGKTGYVPNETDAVEAYMAKQALRMPARPQANRVNYDQPSFVVAERPRGEMKSVRLNPSTLDKNDSRRDIYYPSSPVAFVRELLPTQYIINADYVSGPN